MNLEEMQAVMRDAECLFDEDSVNAAIGRVAEELNARMDERPALLVCVMTGGLVFTGKLLPLLRFPLELDYIHATRYRGDTQGQELEWRVPLRDSLQGRTVIVLDDILDEGGTLLAIVRECRCRGAEQVLTAVLTEKLHDRKACPGLKPDHVGLQVPDRYVFGSGMDYRDFWRNAPGIHAPRGH